MTSYSNVHFRLTRTRGAAATHSCTCGKVAAEWAYTHDNPCPDERQDQQGKKYSTDLARYLPMCLRCHRLYDKAVITHCPHGHEYSGHNLRMDAGKRKCRACGNARDRERKRNAPPEQKARRAEAERLRKARVRQALRGQQPHDPSVRTKPTLTPEIVRVIRATPLVRGTRSQLAAQYGVSRTTIRKVLSGATWRHVQ